jgi:hypothetical protein
MGHYGRGRRQRQDKSTLSPFLALDGFRSGGWVIAARPFLVHRELDDAGLISSRQSKEAAPDQLVAPPLLAPDHLD